MKQLTIREIARECGVSEGAVYRNWNLSDLTPEIVADAIEEKARVKDTQATMLLIQVQSMYKYAAQLREAAKNEVQA